MKNKQNGLSNIESFVVYKLERRSATLSGMAFDTNSTEEQVKQAIDSLNNKGYTISEQAGWYHLHNKPKVK